MKEVFHVLILPKDIFELLHLDIWPLPSVRRFQIASRLSEKSAGYGPGSVEKINHLKIYFSVFLC